MGSDEHGVECAVCFNTALDPKQCAVCFTEHGDRSQLCRDCRKECPACGESVCYDHWAESRQTCSACEYERYVESGEAKYDYDSWARGAW